MKNWTFFYPPKSIPCLLLAWWRKEPGHQYPCFCLVYRKYSGFSTRSPIHFKLWSFLFFSGIRYQHRVDRWNCKHHIQTLQRLLWFTSKIYLLESNHQYQKNLLCNRSLYFFYKKLHLKKSFNNDDRPLMPWYKPVQKSWISWCARVAEVTGFLINSFQPSKTCITSLAFGT